MRKTSQDGGDTTSIKSGIENEIKKSGAAIKNKRNSIKRKVQNFSNESDDAVIEPLLQKDREKSETEQKQSAKYSISKSKTETESDKVKLLTDNNMPKTSDFPSTSGIIMSSSITKESLSHKPQVTSTAPIHNHMNTNVFNNFDSAVGVIATKSQILVEIDGSKQGSYNPSPLIFTTAKIHTDGKTKHMEPVQVTPVPIISTVEVNVTKAGKVNETSSNTQLSSTSADRKITDTQPMIYTPTSVNISAPCTNHKDTVSKTNSESKTQNNSNNYNMISSNTTQKDPTSLASDFKGPQNIKFISKIENKVIKSSSIKDDKNITTVESIMKTTAPHSILPSSDNKTITSATSSKLSSATKNIIGTSPNTNKDESYKINHPTRKDKLHDIKNLENSPDVNKNIKNFESIISSNHSNKQESFDNLKMLTNVSKSSDMFAKDTFTKDINSKQLPRQKNAITDDSNDLILSSKPSGSDNSITSNTNIAKHSDVKMVPPKKSLIDSKVSDDNKTGKVNDKNTPKSSANNIAVPIKSSTKINPSLSTSKPSLSSISTTKPAATTTISSSTSVTTSTVTSTRTTSAPSNNTKTMPAAGTKPLVSAASTAASSEFKWEGIIGEETSNKPQTALTKPAPTTSSIIPVKVSKVSTVKSSDTVVSPHTTTAVKAPAPSTAKANTTKTTPQTILTGKTKVSTTIGSTVSSSISKPSTSNPTNAPLSLGKSKGSSSAMKTGNTIPTAEAPVKNSVPNKKNGTKSSELNKDDKGLKA